MNGFPLITTLTLVPLVGAVLVAGLGRDNAAFARGLAFALGLLSLAMALVMWKSFDPTSGALQFEERHEWIPTLHIQYHVAVDGLGL